MKKHHFPRTPYPFWKKVLDALFLPVMYIISGTFTESPQQTHAWNFVPIPQAHLSALEGVALYTPAPIHGARQWLFGWIPLFHIPIFGGWKKYHVLCPVKNKGENIGVWHIAYKTEERAKYSLFPLTTPVRILIGPGSVFFFGITSDGKKVSVEKIGEGTIGDNGTYKKLPLL